MVTYFLTETITREGMITVKEAPTRSDGIPKLAERFGVNIEEWFYTVGPFDFIMKVTAPDDESVAAFAMALRASGNVLAQSAKAYTPDAWKTIVARIP